MPSMVAAFLFDSAVASVSCDAPNVGQQSCCWQTRFHVDNDGPRPTRGSPNAHRTLLPRRSCRGGHGSPPDASAGSRHRAQMSEGGSLLAPLSFAPATLDLTVLVRRGLPGSADCPMHPAGTSFCRSLRERAGIAAQARALAALTAPALAHSSRARACAHPASGVRQRVTRPRVTRARCPACDTRAAPRATAPVPPGTPARGSARPRRRPDKIAGSSTFAPYRHPRLHRARYQIRPTA